MTQGTAMRWPKPIGSPVLDSLHPVIEHSRDVSTDVERIVEVAKFMAYEALPMPEYALPYGIGNEDRARPWISSWSRIRLTPRSPISRPM